MDTYTDSSESDGRSDNEGGHSLQGCSQYKTSINIIMHRFADIFVCFIICIDVPMLIPEFSEEAKKSSQ